MKISGKNFVSQMLLMAAFLNAIPVIAHRPSLIPALIAALYCSRLVKSCRAKPVLVLNSGK